MELGLFYNEIFWRLFGFSKYRDKSMGKLFDFGNHKFYIEYKASYILRDR